MIDHIQAIVNSSPDRNWSIEMILARLSSMGIKNSKRTIIDDAQRLCRLGTIKKIQSDKGTVVHYEGCYREIIAVMVEDAKPDYVSPLYDPSPVTLFEQFCQAITKDQHRVLFFSLIGVIGFALLGGYRLYEFIRAVIG